MMEISLHFIAWKISEDLFTKTFFIIRNLRKAMKFNLTNRAYGGLRTDVS